MQTKRKEKKYLYINWQIVHLCGYHKLYDNDYLIALGASHQKLQIFLLNEVVCCQQQHDPFILGSYQDWNEYISTQVLG